VSYPQGETTVSSRVAGARDAAEAPVPHHEQVCIGGLVEEDLRRLLGHGPHLDRIASAVLLTSVMTSAAVCRAVRSAATRGFGSDGAPAQGR